MVKELEKPQDCYSEYIATYTPKQRKNWYSEIADAYNKTRPRYPQQLINRVFELAELPAGANILELGCGPGIATVPFADFGFSMLCLEPSQEACQLARHNCAAYPSVEIQNLTFEEWELEAEKFTAVLAATSFHWVSPEIRYQKTAAALKNKGSLILLWNAGVLPPDEVYRVLDKVYQVQAPSLAEYHAKKKTAAIASKLPMFQLFTLPKRPSPFSLLFLRDKSAFGNSRPSPLADLSGHSHS